METLSWTEAWVAKVLTHGHIPKHVALILDGSRRWARVNGVPLRNAHKHGYATLKEITAFLYAIGVEELTCYVFSLGNFNRSKEEIDSLMNLFEVELDEIIKLGPNERCRFFGQRSLFPETIQRKFAIIEELTKDYKNKTMNIAAAYTCQDDITQGIKAILKTDVDSKAISIDLLEKNMFFGSSKVDLLIRTSGETRLSDFLMWEVRKTLQLTR